MGMGLVSDLQEHPEMDEEGKKGLVSSGPPFFQPPFHVTGKPEASHLLRNPEGKLELRLYSTHRRMCLELPGYNFQLPAINRWIRLPWF